jgi:hypothetical protein
MWTVIKLKEGVQMGDSLAPAGARILEVLKHLAGDYPFDLVITSARDGVHSGPADPHHSGEAFDLRVHHLTIPQLHRLLSDLKAELYKDPRRFFVQLEGEGTPNAHIHCQRRKGTVYSMLDYLADL